MKFAVEIPDRIVDLALKERKEEFAAFPSLTLCQGVVETEDDLVKEALIYYFSRWHFDELSNIRVTKQKLQGKVMI